MSYLQLQDPTLERSFRGHKDVITGLAFKPSMTQVASASMDHSVMVWNFKPQLRAFRFVGHKAPVTSVDFSPTGHLLASSSRDTTVRLWTPNVKGDVTVFKAHTSTVRTVQFARDSESLLTASDDKTVKLWSAHRTKFQYTLAGHLNWVRAAKFSPDSRLVVSGSDDKTVKLWDLRSKTCVKTYWDHIGMVTSVAFHPSGTVVASASTDRSIKLFDIRTHKLMQHYGDAHVPSGSGVGGGGVNSIGFGGMAGEWLISTGMDGVVKIWDLKEGHLFYTLHGHKQGPTTSAVFSPQGDFFATGGSDAQVMVWKSNFDEISKLADEQEGEEQPPRRKLPHSQSQHPHQPHALHTEPGITNGTASRGKSPVAINPGANGVAHKKQVNTGVVNVGAGLFAEQDIEEEGATTYQQQASRSQSRSPERPNEHTQSYTAALEERTVPDQLANTLQQIVRQLDILTQTMNIMESRLTMNEDRVVAMNHRMEEMFTRLEQQQQQSNHPSPPAPSTRAEDSVRSSWQPPTSQQTQPVTQPVRAWEQLDPSINSGIAPSAPPLHESHGDDSRGDSGGGSEGREGLR
ncbi:POC1 centriolar protein A [Rhizophlyctis rosea]|uniref:POC1 centriolar protein A n=1 Tax=Rhizophlyctis rosea TaxID=64517 RepID=A0AAD5SIL7_9FUNG|nr:POC1 centriolar protein A [Rhizophlyctis rosea]